MAATGAVRVLVAGLGTMGLSHARAYAAIDGFELADVIRQHPRFQKTAIIFISGVHLNDSDKLQGYRSGAVDYIVSGGGARNGTLMGLLAQRLQPLGCTVSASKDFGLPVEAKEAAAFALLAWQTWHRLPGNVAAATGAGRPAILGQVTYA